MAGAAGKVDGTATGITGEMVRAATFAKAMTVATGCTGICGIADASATKTLVVFFTMKFASKHVWILHDPDQALAISFEV